MGAALQVCGGGDAVNVAHHHPGHGDGFDTAGDGRQCQAHNSLRYEFKMIAASRGISAGEITIPAPVTWAMPSTD